MNNRLKGKVALVTGGNSGIGKETVHRFLEEGATVYFTGGNPKTIEETVNALGRGKVTGIRCDSNLGFVQVLKRIEAAMVAASLRAGGAVTHATYALSS
jgi:NAD(P)-dependent dehydrogenase (short-subunit alcohol dehydrogenase family)